MDVQVRKIRADEAEMFVRSVRVPFLEPPTGESDDNENLQSQAARVPTDRAFVAEAEGRFVGNACNYTMDVTVPGLPGQPAPILPMAGVSAVGVHPTHRRRGLLRKLMASLLDEARSRNEPLAGLIASESIIYGRFGFGLASDMAEYRIDSHRSAFAVAAPDLDIRFVENDEAAKLLPDLFESCRRTRPGEPGRDAKRWEEILTDRPGSRGGGLGIFRAVCDGGYVAYRAHDADVLRGDRLRIVAEELRGETAEIEAALWRFLLDLDLIGSVSVRRRPVDEPLRWRLSDPRQLRTVSVDDRLYIRVLDVPAALQGRSYEGDGRLVLDIQPPPVDGESDPVVGRWVLEADSGRASCRPARADEDPDLRLGILELGSLYLGGFAPSLLAAAGRVEELTAGSLTVADTLFTTRLAPLSGTGF